MKEKSILTIFFVDRDDDMLMVKSLHGLTRVFGALRKNVQGETNLFIDHVSRPYLTNLGFRSHLY